MLRGLFRTKNLDDILATAGGPGISLKRTLGAFNVTLIGIGAIIGAGIFSTVGTAAAGVADGRPGAGPALVISFILVAIACSFAALCYAEFAAMVPVSGSAYTVPCTLLKRWQDPRDCIGCAPEARRSSSSAPRPSLVWRSTRAAVW